MEVVSTNSYATVLTCKICTGKSAKYTCPRCSINYCSLACYRDRRHGKCSEEFYRECCENAIRGMAVDDEQRQQVERMLSQDDDNRYQSEGSEEESSSEENPGDLSERYSFFRIIHIRTSHAIPLQQGVAHFNLAITLINRASIIPLQANLTL